MKLDQLKRQLEAEGFRRCDSADVLHKLADEMWQLRLRDGSGKTLYFVTAYVYFGKTIDGTAFPLSVELEAIFYRGERPEPWYVLKINEPHTIASAVGCFADFYDRMGCVPDKHNN